MIVLMAGGTGFIGQHLTRELINAGHHVILARRPVSGKPIPQHESISVLQIDPEMQIEVHDFAADIVINLVGIIREFPSSGITFHKAHFSVTKNLVDFAKRMGIPRFLQMSALGVKPGSTSGYMQSKYISEQYVEESGLEWAIFRPSVVFGPNDHIVTLFSSLLRIFPVIGVVGNGQYKLQPVHISDVTAGFMKALKGDMALGRVFEIGGPEIMTFDRLLDIIGEAIGRTRVRKVHIPVGPLKWVSALLDWFPKYPISPEQIDLLLDGNYTEDNSYYEFVGRKPTPFKDGIAQYLRPGK
jgi:NADH dehydrogenase